MAIGLDELPFDPDGALTGMWHVHLRTPLSDNYSGVTFREGKSVEPIGGNMIRRLVAGMGHEIERVIRVGDGCVIGEPLAQEDRVNNREPFETQPTDPAPDRASYERASLPRLVDDPQTAPEPRDVPAYADLMSMNKRALRKFAELEYGINAPAGLTHSELAEYVIREVERAPQ